MKSKLMLLSAVALAGSLAGSHTAETAGLPLVVSSLTGTLRIEQGVPCASDIDRTVPVTGGRLELSPSEGVSVGGGGKLFSLTRANLSFGGFSVSRSCAGFDETRTYGDIRVQVTRAVTFTAAPTPTPGVFSISIPVSQFEIFYATTVNGSLDTGTKQPKEPVTGTIDMNTGIMTMRVVLATKVTFKAGCTLLGCVINETKDGTQTANITGVMVFPDSDSDGVADRSDNCKYVPNPDQTPVPTPTITAPADVTLNSCLDRRFGRAAAADVCEGGPVTVTNNAPSVFLVGGNVVTWRAQDQMSRVATDTQNVTIVDTTIPTFSYVPPDVAMNNCGAAVLGTPVATDDCAGTPTLSNNAPSYFYVGTTPVTWTATDASGNAGTALQKVTVVDTVAPTVTCEQTGPSSNMFRISAVDACSTALTIKLGSYDLTHGETILIKETGQSGVRLVNTLGPDGMKHFQVGRGEAVITVTDPSSNVTTISCAVK